MNLMDETQFSLEVWNLLPKTLMDSAIQMTEKEVAWNKSDSIFVINTFQKAEIAVIGIEFFFFNNRRKQIFTTSDIFASNNKKNESWREFVLRSNETASIFVNELKFDSEELQKGEPVFNIWAFNREEFFNSI